MAHLPLQLRYTLGAASLCALAACGDSTGPDINHPYHFVAVSVGDYHTCGISTDSTLLCWGYNRTGQLGDGTRETRFTPTPVNTDLRFSSLSLGGSHTCAIATDGSTHCWGYNYDGQLGDETEDTRLVPTALAGNLKFTEVSAGWRHTCAISEAGDAYCWGGNEYGQLGTTTTEECGDPDRYDPCSTVPVPVSGGSAFEQIAAGSQHSCGITDQGFASCWGYNTDGQLGDGTDTERHAPTRLQLDLAMASLSAGASHSCALSEQGMLFCWGSNGHGQLASGSTAMGWYTPTIVWGW